jgi:hypothetical protein
MVEIICITRCVSGIEVLQGKHPRGRNTYEIEYLNMPAEYLKQQISWKESKFVVLSILLLFYKTIYSNCISPFNIFNFFYSKFSERWKRNTRNVLPSWNICFAYTYHPELLHIKSRSTR